MYVYQAPPILSVSVLARYLKEVLETDDILHNVWVQGEISGCKTYASGHCYFTLKDAEANCPASFLSMPACVHPRHNCATAWLLLPTAPSRSTNAMASCNSTWRASNWWAKARSSCALSS